MNFEVRGIVRLRSPWYEMREMGLSIRKLTPAIGAEVEGVDFSGGVSDAQLAQVRQALLDNLVVSSATRS